MAKPASQLLVNEPLTRYNSWRAVVVWQIVFICQPNLGRFKQFLKKFAYASTCAFLLVWARTC